MATGALRRLKLTARSVESLTPPEHVPQEVYWDTELAGFGVRVGAHTKSFIVKARVGSKQCKATIGIYGRPREDGQLWTVQLARVRARELLGQMAAGIDPNADNRAKRGELTLRQGLDLHVGDMRKRRCSQRSIGTIEYEVPKYLGRWIDRPISELTGLVLHNIHEDLSDRPYLANRVVAEVSAIWNTVDRVHELPGRNPASRVRRHKLSPKRERIDDADLPAWYQRVQTLSPIRRDLQLLLLFTGLRSADARSIRWDHVDLENAALHRPHPKGGEAKAFTLPLCGAAIDALRSRRRSNPVEMAVHGGDHGFVFPSVTRARPFRVQPLAEAKERRINPETNCLEQFLPSPHTLRRTYISVGREIGIAEIDMHALANHSFAAAKVQDQYVRQAFHHLLDCQRKIERALWARIKRKHRRRA